MTQIAERLRLHMQKVNISMAELARRSDVKPSFIIDIINGKSTNPSGIKLARVSQALGVNINSLVGGDDRPLDTMHSPSDDQDYIAIPGAEMEISREGDWDSSLAYSGGKPYYFRRSWIRNRLGVMPDDLRIFTVQGDSMTPTLCHNDIVLVDITKKQPTPAGIFLLHDTVGLAVKRMEFVPHSHPAQIKVMADNNRYGTYTHPAEELRILGRVIWFSREMM